jgi:hypothetical protein
MGTTVDQRDLGPPSNSDGGGTNPYTDVNFEDLDRKDI